MAEPAQIANDMEAHARFWWGRNREVSSTCADAGRMIRRYLACEKVDGRAHGGLHARLLRLEKPSESWQAYPNFTRARLTLDQLRKEAQ